MNAIKKPKKFSWLFSLPTIVIYYLGVSPSINLVMHETFCCFQTILVPRTIDVDHPMPLSVPLLLLLTNKHIARVEIIQCRVEVTCRGGKFVVDYFAVFPGPVFGHGGKVGECEAACVALVRQVYLLVPLHVVHQVLLEHERLTAALVRTNPVSYALVKFHVTIKRLPVSELFNKN